MLAPLRDPIELDLYAGRLAEETGVGKESVMASAKRAAAGVNRQRRREQLKAQQQVAAARTVGNPEKQRHMRAAPGGRRYLGLPFSPTRRRRGSWKNAFLRKNSSPSGTAEYTLFCWARLNRAKPPSPTSPES